MPHSVLELYDLVMGAQKQGSCGGSSYITHVEECSNFITFLTNPVNVFYGVEEEP